MFHDGLFDFLTTNSTISALLGTSRSDASKGVFPTLAIGSPILPYIVFMRLSALPVFSMAGTNRLTTSRVRFSSYASSQKGAVALSAAIRAAFATWTGTLPDGTVVQQVQLEMESDDSEAMPRGTVFAVHSDFQFTFVQGD